MIAITFALPAESSDFVRLLENRGTVSREGIETTRGHLHEKSLVVIHTGVGKKVSRERMETILHRERFEYLISSGFAGAGISGSSTITSREPRERRCISRAMASSRWS